MEIEGRIDPASTTSRCHEAAWIDIAIQLIELVLSIHGWGVLLKILDDLNAYVVWVHYLVLLVEW